MTSVSRSDHDDEAPEGTGTGVSAERGASVERAAKSTAKGAAKGGAAQATAKGATKGAAQSAAAKEWFEENLPAERRGWLK